MGEGERSLRGGVDDVRFQRQIVLREVGYGGQARLGAATARVPAAGLRGEVASLYARRAGFGAVVAVEAEGAGVPEAPSWVASPEAAEVIAGSLAALRAFASAVLGPGAGGGR
jgi:hypothetical protein